MRQRIVCVLVETAAAEFMRPLFEQWISQRPTFDWVVLASPATLNVLADVAHLPETAIAVIDPMSSVASQLKQFIAGRPSAAIISAGSWPAEFAAVRAARDGGLPVLRVVDNWYGYRRRLWDGHELVLGDRLLVIDEVAKLEARAEGIPADRLFAVGHPAWQDIESLPDTTSKDVVFLGAPVARNYGTDLGYTEHESWALLQAARAKRPDLFGRILYAPHPTMDPPGDIGDALVVRYRRALLRDVGVVAGMFSAPLVEAFLARRRVVTLQPCATARDMCPLSRHGFIPRTSEVDGVIAALSAPLSDPAVLAKSLRGSRRRVVEQIDWALAA